MGRDHYELMEHFEREYRGCFRLDREPKNIWPGGRVYQDSRANDSFLAYRRGYALGKAVAYADA